MRGEYGALSTRQAAQAELPPRARRIHGEEKVSYTTYGTTSACAENTDGWLPNHWRQRNYLRVRGEYHAAPPTTPTQSELPPRARRILLQAFLHVFPCGTTSACAENTLFPAAGQVKSRNYLRVRGEYAAAVADPVLCSGTTSACAENTSHQFTGGSIRGNYLRVRGEYHLEVWMDQLGKELPPRARRILPL